MFKTTKFILIFTFAMLLISSLSMVTFASYGTWESIGTPVSSMNNVDLLSSVSDSNGNIYIVYRDKSDSYKVKVSKYVLTGLANEVANWENLGTNISTISNGSSITNLSISLDSGTPYVAYNDPSTSKPAVVKYNSATSAWGQVGTTIGTAPLVSGANSVCLKFDSGTPYILARTGSGTLTLYKYTASAWTAFSTTSITNASKCALEVSGGVPYIACTTSSNTFTIKKFSNSAWSSVGSSTSAFATPQSTPYLSMCFDNNSNLNVGYLSNSGPVIMAFSSSNQSWSAAMSASGSASAMSPIYSKSNLNGFAYVNGTTLYLKSGNGTSWNSTSTTVLSDVTIANPSACLINNSFKIVSTELQSGTSYTKAVVRSYKEYSINAALFSVKIVANDDVANAQTIEYITPLEGQLTANNAEIPKGTTKVELSIIPFNGSSTIKLDGEELTSVIEDGQQCFKKTINDFTLRTFNIKVISEYSVITPTFTAGIKDYTLQIAFQSGYNTKVKNISKETNKYSSNITFVASDFINAVVQYDKSVPVASQTLSKIKITKLPMMGKLKINNIDVTLGQEISSESIPLLQFEISDEWSGNTSFGWKGFDGVDYSSNTGLVTLHVIPNQAEINAEDAIMYLPTEATIVYADKSKVENARGLVQTAVDNSLTPHVPSVDYINGITKLVALENKMLVLKQIRDTALATVNTAIAKLPAANAMTLLDESLLNDAVYCANDANGKDVVNTEITGYEKIAELKARLLELVLEDKLKSNEDAINAISAIPVLTEFTTENVNDFDNKVTIARNAVYVALKKSVTLSEVTNYNKLVEAVRNISTYKAEAERYARKLATAAKADNAIELLPEVDTLVLSDYQSVETARSYVRDALILGVLETSITKINKLIALEYKIIDLNASMDQSSKKAVYVAVAVANIDKIHIPQEFSDDDRELVKFAEASIATALQNGVAEADITNISRYKEMKDKIEAIDKEIKRQQIISDVVTQIDKLSNTAKVNEYLSGLVYTARQQVEKALANTDYGTIIESDITNLLKLVDLEDQCKVYIKNNIISQIKSLISQLPELGSIMTLSVDQQLDSIATKIKDAEFYGVYESDIDATFLSKYNALKAQRVADAMVSALDLEIRNMYYKVVIGLDSIDDLISQYSAEQIAQAKTKADEFQTRYEILKNTYGIQDRQYYNLEKLQSIKANINVQIDKLNDIAKMTELISSLNKNNLTYKDISTLEKISELYAAVNNRIKRSLITCDTEAKDLIGGIRSLEISETARMDILAETIIANPISATLAQIDKKIADNAPQITLEMQQAYYAANAEYQATILKNANGIRKIQSQVEEILKMKKVLISTRKVADARVLGTRLGDLLKVAQNQERRDLEGKLEFLGSVEGYCAYGDNDQIVVDLRKTVNEYCKTYSINESELANINNLQGIEKDIINQKKVIQPILSKVAMLPSLWENLNEFQANNVLAARTLIEAVHKEYPNDSNKWFENNFNLSTPYLTYSHCSITAEKFNPEKKKCLADFESMYKRLIPIYDSFVANRNLESVKSADINACTGARDLLRKFDNLELSRFVDMDKQNTYVKMARELEFALSQRGREMKQVEQNIDSVLDDEDGILNFSGFTFTPNLTKIEQEAQLDWAKQQYSKLKYEVSFIKEMLDKLSEENREIVSNLAKYNTASKKIKELSKSLTTQSKVVKTDYTKYTYAMWDSLVKDLNKTPGGAVQNLCCYIDETKQWKAFNDYYITQGGRDEFYRGATSSMKADFVALLDDDYVVSLFPECIQSVKELAKTDTSGKYDDLLDELVGDTADMIGSALSGDPGDLLWNLALTGVKAGINAGKANSK